MAPVTQMMYINCSISLEIMPALLTTSVPEVLLSSVHNFTEDDRELLHSSSS